MVVVTEVIEVTGFMWGGGSEPANECQVCFEWGLVVVCYRSFSSSGG